MSKSEYYLPCEEAWIRVEYLSLYDEMDLIELIHHWFNENYINPVENCPVDKGEYIYIYGGPFRVDEVLYEEFEGVINKDMLEKAYKQIPNKDDDFSLIPDRFWSDYTIDDPYLIFKEHITDIERLRAVQNNDIELHKKYISLLFVNTITSFETFISDELINRVKDDSGYLKLFLERAKGDRFITQKEDIVEKIYAITFSNPKKLKNYFLDIFNIQINNLDELKKLNDLRNDIMHRNGKNTQGEILMNGDMDLDWCISQINATVEQIIKN